MALAGRRRPVVEYMAEVPAAAATMFLGAEHRQRRGATVGYGVWKRFPETRPARAAVIFRGRAEQGEIAAGAGVHTFALFLEQRTGERPLRAGFAQDVIALLPKAAAPFGRAVPDFKRRGRSAARGEQANPGNRARAEEAEEQPAVRILDHCAGDIASQAECRLPRRHGGDACWLWSI
jgi:hypothetical protein